MPNRTCYSINDEGYITWVAKNIKDLTGWEQDEVIGKHFFELIDDKDHTLIVEKRANRPHGKIDEYQTNLKLKNGLLMPIRIKVLQTPENSVGYIDRRLEDRHIERDERNPDAV
jgi:PAS domain S-box-containing protein